MRAFVTGTDTGVGKTFATALLTRALRAFGRRTIALKPVCSGDRSDARILAAAAGDELAIEAVNPLWFPLPLAPFLAARSENRTISVPALAAWFRETSSGHDSVLVEGAGGWLTPLAPGTSIADLCAALGLPVVVVAANRLGCVNHTLLTVDALPISSGSGASESFSTPRAPTIPRPRTTGSSASAQTSRCSPKSCAASASSRRKYCASSSMLPPA